MKDVTLITIYIIKRFIDHSEETLIRPRAEGRSISKLEIEASNNIMNYLID